VLGETEAHRPAAAPAHLTHPRQLGTGLRHVDIVALALAESPAIFGFILGVQGEDPKSTMLLFGIALVAMLANNPASFFAKADDDA
jgi:hypothetical protein